LADAKYDWVIVDEAGRCTPSELAVAIQSGHRLILVGDHLQLPPFFDDQIRSAIREHFPAVPDRQLFVSDFERVFERFKAQGAGYSLLQQHRMAPAIGELVSSVFYGGDLITARGEAAEWTRSLPDDLSEEVVWIDTSAAGSAAFESREPYTKSFLNRFEAEVIVRLLEEIDASDAALEVLLDPTRPTPIGVICPYAAQARVIRNLLAKSSVSPALQSRIKVGTVDSYQGKQNDLIFLSLTRANSRGDVGFVRDRARANVSLSRAKERLVIVGAAQTWGHSRSQNSPFGEVLEFIRARAGTAGFAMVAAKHKERRE
jgi:superfamily I DNA and/or RNA helicase